MIHLVFIRCVLVAYVISLPYILIYFQQSLYRASFDDELGNKLILRLHVVSAIVSFALFLATFDGGRQIFQ